MKNTTAIYPGTFDPITNGHLDIIERASDLFDKVIVTIALNAGKTPMFSSEERRNMIMECIQKYKNVEVEYFDGLLVRFAKEKNATVIIRGLRAISDFDYEFQICQANRKLEPGINTIFLMPNEKYTYLNSSLIRELASYDANIKEFIPENVLKRLKEKKK